MSVRRSLAFLLWSRTMGVPDNSTSVPFFRHLRFVPWRMNVSSAGYAMIHIEWPCGADLSADTIEAHWVAIDDPSARVYAAGH